MPRYAFAAFVSALLLSWTTGCVQIAEYSKEYRLTTPWADYERLVVTTRNGPVTVEPAAGAPSEVEIAGRLHAGGWTMLNAIENLQLIEVQAAPDPKDARTLIVRLQCPEDAPQQNYGASMTIRLPQSVAANVTTSNGAIRVTRVKQSVLETRNGPIEARDVDGRLEVSASNGRVLAEGVRGDVRLETSNGGVIARAIQGNAFVQTSNGDIEAADIAGDLDASTSNGNLVAAAQPRPEGRVSLVSSNGSIRAVLSTQIKGALDLSTSNGSLTTEMGDATLSHWQVSKQRVAGRLNGGGAGQILARTSNGSVTVECR